jgi:hypothetical protein
MPDRALLAAIAFVGLAACSKEQTGVAGYPYAVANYLPAQPGLDKEVLRLFPSEGPSVTITLPFRFVRIAFALDGKSIYGTLWSGKYGIDRELPGLSKIEFSPTRITTVPGTASFVIRSFALSTRQDTLVISGHRADQDETQCGILEVLIPSGTVKQVPKTDCRYHVLGVSPDGSQAIATVGDGTEFAFHRELIDLASGTTKSFGSEFPLGVWSPDWNWIATIRNHELSIVNAHDPSKRRSLGATTVIEPEWSPDSRYLMLRKYALFKCGFYIDTEPPATLEMLDISSGERSTIRSSECQLSSGYTGWLSNEILK